MPTATSNGIGVLVSGIIVGWLLVLYLRRMEKFSMIGFSSAVTVIFGGAIIKWLSPEKILWWLYPVGIALYVLVINIILYIKYKDIAYCILGKLRITDKRTEENNPRQI